MILTLMRIAPVSNPCHTLLFKTHFNLFSFPVLSRKRRKVAPRSLSPEVVQDLPQRRPSGMPQRALKRKIGPDQQPPNLPAIEETSSREPRRPSQQQPRSPMSHRLPKGAGEQVIARQASRPLPVRIHAPADRAHLYQRQDRGPADDDRPIAPLRRPFAYNPPGSRASAAPRGYIRSNSRGHLEPQGYLRDGSRGLPDTQAYMRPSSREVSDTYTDVYSRSRQGSRAPPDRTPAQRNQAGPEDYWRPDSRYVQNINPPRMGYLEPPETFGYIDEPATLGLHGYPEEVDEYYEDEEDRG